MKKQTVEELFSSARRVSVPLLVVRTADQCATVKALVKVDDPQYAHVQWDAARGLTAVETDPAKLAKDPGAKLLKGLGTKLDDGFTFKGALGLAAAAFPQGTVLFMHNAHLQLQCAEPLQVAGERQAVANARDPFKQNFRMAVLLGVDFKVPAELAQDVMVATHELPGPAELGRIVVSLHESAQLAKPDAESQRKAEDALSGLSAFSAEQQVATSLTVGGLQHDLLWERKRVAIEQTRGLKLYRGGATFDDLQGLDAIKARLRRLRHAKIPTGPVVFIDEIDKSLANVEHDTSGVRMDQLRTLLTRMEDYEWQGLIAVGVPGAGKTALARAFGNECGVPTIELDFAAMEGGIVGESETNLRHAMQVIDAVGRGHAFVFATSNAMTKMRPELKRRFTAGTYFFDLPTAAERQAVWAYYLRKYELKAQPMPTDDAWSPAEIRNCAREAWNTGCTLLEAAATVVPAAQAGGPEMEELRKGAHGRYLDATQPGPYQYRPEVLKQQLRAIQLLPEPVLAMKES